MQFRDLFINKFVIAFLLIYCSAIAVLQFSFQKPFGELLNVTLIFGIIFPFISWVLVAGMPRRTDSKPSFKNEALVLVAIILFITWYITYGTGWINSFIPNKILSIEWLNDIYILAKKSIVFVLLLFSLYKAFGFTLYDFGFKGTLSEIFTRKIILIFIVLTVMAIVAQYYFGHGGEELQKNHFSSIQLLASFPLCFIWLFFEVGLVEEFFFRALLQSKISVLLKSNIAGILVSGLIFGLAHAPGLYLRGAGSEGITEPLPFFFWAAFSITAMSLAGIFLGIVWSKTRNIYLVAAIHAMVDLIPNLTDFIHTWSI